MRHIGRFEAGKMVITEIGQLPDGSALAWTIAEFDDETLPAGLLRAHRVAAGVWGVINVRAGQVRFRFDDGEGHLLSAGDRLVIAPDRLHRVSPFPDARFAVEFHRSSSDENVTITATDR